MVSLPLTVAAQAPCDPIETPMRMAVEAYNNAIYLEAAEMFEALAVMAPTNRYTETAMRYSAYAAYQAENPDAARYRFCRAVKAYPGAAWRPRAEFDWAMVVSQAAPLRALEMLSALEGGDTELLRAVTNAQARLVMRLAVEEQKAKRYAAAIRLYRGMKGNPEAQEAARRLAESFPEADTPRVICEAMPIGWQVMMESLTAHFWPQIVAALGADPAALPQTVHYRLSETQEAPGVASGNRITLSAEWLRKRPDDTGMILHELVHVAQGYPSGKVPGWLTESIADYLRYYVLAPEPPSTPKKTASYREGYRTGAWFLNRLIRLSESDTFLAELNAICKKGEDAAEWLEARFGKTLDELWNDCFE